MPAEARGIRSLKAGDKGGVGPSVCVPRADLRSTLLVPEPSLQPPFYSSSSSPTVLKCPSATSLPAVPVLAACLPPGWLNWPHGTPLS